MKKIRGERRGNKNALWKEKNYFILITAYFNELHRYSNASK